MWVEISGHWYNLAFATRLQYDGPGKVGYLFFTEAAKETMRSSLGPRSEGLVIPAERMESLVKEVGSLGRTGLGQSRPEGR